MSYHGAQPPISKAAELCAKAAWALSRGETAALLRQLSGREAVMAGLLYGSGLRLMECMRLRIKDVDFERNEITLRDGKGGKDRRTVLPASLRETLRLQIDSARLIHVRDAEAGFGEAWLPCALPCALARKYPNAAKLTAWRYVFPASRRSIDPRDGRERRHHIDETRLH